MLSPRKDADILFLSGGSWKRLVFGGSIDAFLYTVLYGGVLG